MPWAGPTLEPKSSSSTERRVAQVFQDPEPASGGYLFHSFDADRWANFGNLTIGELCLAK